MIPDRYKGLPGWISFSLMSAIVLCAPWCFGAWEQWWFWPFLCLILISALIITMRIGAGESQYHKALASLPRSGIVAAAAWTIFLAYALTRTFQADVYMDAERSFLLFLTPTLIFFTILLGFSGAHFRILFLLVVIDLAALAAYGLVNHQRTGSSMVLWVRTPFTQYAGRASGPYFCPDHFSGLMELLLALALGIVFLRGRVEVPYAPRWNGLQVRIFAAPMILMAMAGVYFSQSRGGLLTALVVSGFALLLATAHLQPALRWILRASSAGLAIIAIAWAWNASPAPVQRFKEYVPDNSGNLPARDLATGIVSRLNDSPRGNMYSAALRAWEPHKWFGVGPGMHRHLWFHYAASPDGDRKTGKWPTRLNYDYHSMETHSDWIQLMEEYGIFGLSLFLIFLISFAIFLSRGLGEKRINPSAGGGLLCLAAMAFHSLGDFNLQIPATTWLLAAILAVPSAMIVRNQK